MIKYSIIIPVYGCERYLEESVNSVLRQKGVHEYEILLVDDGSVDRSGEIADALAVRHERVRVFHKENGGAASARNFGIRQAGGKYLLFVDGDDTVEECLLETIDKALDQDEQAMIVYGVVFDYYLNRQIERSTVLSCAHQGRIQMSDMLREFPEFFYDNALSGVWNKVFSTDLIRRYGLQFHEGMTLYEDYEFVLRYLTHISSVFCVGEVLYRYRNDLEQSHLGGRVRDLEKLRRNMAQLLKAGTALAELPQYQTVNSPLMNVSADLYIQMLISHLMTADDKEEMKHRLPEYCAEPLFRGLLASGAVLSERNRQLLAQIDAECFRQIRWEYIKKKRISALKRAAKKYLRRIGWRR